MKVKNDYIKRYKEKYGVDNSLNEFISLIEKYENDLNKDISEFTKDDIFGISRNVPNISQRISINKGLELYYDLIAEKSGVSRFKKEKLDR